MSMRASVFFLSIGWACGSLWACSAGSATIGVTRGSAATAAESGGQGDGVAGAGANDKRAPAGTAGTAGSTAEALGSPAGNLAVTVENESHVALTLVTVACHGECADVQAVATHGYPPYTFRWEDGSSDPMRRLCPTVSATYSVVATDNGSSTGEFARAPQTASAEVKTQVSDCSSSNLCIQNPSFEGTAVYNLGSFDAPPWKPCGVGTPDIWNETQSFLGAAPGPKPSAGKTYLAMYHLAANNYFESVSQPLCAPLLAGKAYSVKLDLMWQTAGAVFDAVPGMLELKASSDACGDGQSLWKSPVAPAQWQTYCVTFTPDQAYTYLTLTGAASAVTDGVYVDNMVPVANCAGMP
jgi:hypothetical protein